MSALLTCIQEGDRSAESELCELLYPGLRLIAQRRANTQDSEDIAQEAMLVVVEAARAKTIASAGAVGSFARSVVYNLCCRKVNMLSQARRQGSSEDVARIRSSSSTPEESAGQRQSLSIARNLLAELNPRQRDLLRRFYLEEQTPEQICDQMGLTATQFRLAKARAKARFSEIGKLHLTRKATGTNSRCLSVHTKRCA